MVSFLCSPVPNRVEIKNRENKRRIHITGGKKTLDFPTFSILKNRRLNSCYYIIIIYLYIIGRGTREIDS